MDKFSFLVGVLTLAVSEFVLLETPNFFWLWYAAFMTSLIAARVPEYRFKKWGYFMLDFCYFANLCNLIHVLFFPTSCAWSKVRRMSFISEEALNATHSPIDPSILSFSRTSIYSCVDAAQMNITR